MILKTNESSSTIFHSLLLLILPAVLIFSSFSPLPFPRLQMLGSGYLTQMVFPGKHNTRPDRQEVQRYEAQKVKLAMEGMDRRIHARG